LRRNPLTTAAPVFTFGSRGVKAVGVSEGDSGMMRARALLLEALVVVAVLAYIGAH